VGDVFCEPLAVDVLNAITDAALVRSTDRRLCPLQNYVIAKVIEGRFLDHLRE